MLDRTRPKAVAESRLHSSSVKVHGAPSPRWNPWQRGRREHPRAGNPRSLPIWRVQVKSNPAQRVDRPGSALVPAGQVHRVRLPGRDPSKDPLTAAGALRHRSTDLDLWAGLSSVHRKGQRDQPVSPTRRAKDHQSVASVPRLHTFHVCDREPSARPFVRGRGAPQRRAPWSARRRTRDRIPRGVRARAATP